MFLRSDGLRFSKPQKDQVQGPVKAVGERSRHKLTIGIRPVGERVNLQEARRPTQHVEVSSETGAAEPFFGDGMESRGFGTNSPDPSM